MSYGHLIQLLGLTQQAYLLLELCHQLSSFFFISHLSCQQQLPSKLLLNVNTYSEENSKLIYLGILKHGSILLHNNYQQPVTLGNNGHDQ